MQNLVLNDHTSREICASSLGLLCVDDITGSIYHVNTEGIQSLKTGDAGETSFNGVVWGDHAICPGNIVEADVITANSAICVVTKEGDVITINKDTQEVEVVGTVSAGLEAACWSPDQELLILVTGEANVVVMTADFDPIVEFSLNQDDFGQNKFINVGWGKKETQFHGTEGKQAAKVVKQTVKTVAEWDDLKPRISWRGDGQLFVVSYVAQDTQSRRLRVINREGILQYTSEDLDGLEQALSWKPAGSLIASSQRLSNKHEVVFFEKNGLKHGEFNLPFKPNEMLVNEVAWNQDSSVLLVWLKPLTETVEGQLTKDIVQLWTTGNYHWYLKQELRFTEGIIYLCWDNVSPLLLHLLTPIHLHFYSWVVTNNISRGISPLDNALVAVIDGTNLLMTPFRQSVVPPPMSAYRVTFTEQINAVMFAPAIVKTCEASPNNSQCVEDSGFLEAFDPPGCNSNNLCVLHGSKTLTFLTQAHANDILDDHGCNVKITGAGGNGFTVKVKVHRVFAQLRIEWDPEEIPKSAEISELCNWVWAAKNTLLACCKNEEDCSIVIIDLQSIGSEAGRVTVKAILPVEESVVSISPSPDGTIAALQLVSGALLVLNLQTQVIEPYTENGEVKFPSVCQQVSLCPVDDGSEIIPLGLTSRNRLYWGNNQLFANCTSYHIHTDHLLITTSNHMLQIVPLMKSALSKLVTGNADVGGVVGLRRVERGSRIVTAVPQDTRVVMQMPRGNLEVVSPRPLAVHTLKFLLNEHKYHKVLDIIRIQRIDLNLVYDHDPADFLVHVTQFVQNVDNPHWIDLFIASLSETDVTETMYSFNYSNRENKGHKNQELGSKIDVVCKAVREAMIAVDEEKFLLPILTTYIKMTPCQMDVALKKIQEMREEKDKKFKVPAEEGLRHLLYIADVNELYNVALGTYDFDLVMMVAEKSQKDPKEYLPFLNDLKQLEENYQRFKINVHLRRFQKALECLRDTDDHKEECLNLIVSEHLYKEAVQIFPSSSDMNKAVCERYGMYLMSKHYYNEAAVMYSRARKLDEALHAYQQAGNWKMVLVVGAQLKFNKEEMNVLCYSLVEALKNWNKHADAAWIYEEYLKNEEEALDCLVKGNQWEDALRVAYKYNRPDLVDTNIKPGALEQYGYYLADIERLASTFKQYCSRLALVRENKEKQHLDFLEGNVEGQLDSDLYSDTSTVTGMTYSRSHTTGSHAGTSASGKTYRSTKNKKKLERKKFSTKEGGAHEDLGLVTALHALCVTADSMATSVTALCTILITFGSDEKAIHLQTSLSKLLTEVDRKKSEIWPTASPTNDEELEFGPQLTTEGVVNRIRGGGGGWDTTFVVQRMRDLDPYLRHAPLVTRPSSWSLHMLRHNR